MIFNIIFLAAGGYLTSVFCRLIPTRRRKIPWFLGFVAPLVIGCLTVLLLFGRIAFDPSDWQASDSGFGPSNGACMLLIFGYSAALSLLPAPFVLWYYQRKLVIANAQPNSGQARL
jgi:hypothetical protein